MKVWEYASMGVELYYFHFYLIFLNLTLNLTPILPYFHTPILTLAFPHIW